MSKHPHIFDRDHVYRIAYSPIEPAEPTQWQKLLAALHLREEEALMVVCMPRTIAARLLREELHRTGIYRKHYVPERVLEAFGWLEEVNMRAAGEWTVGRPRKLKVKKVSMPLLEKVQS